MKIINENESIKKNVNRINKEIINLKNKIEYIDYYKIHEEIKKDYYYDIFNEDFERFMYSTNHNIVVGLNQLFNAYDYYIKLEKTIKSIYDDLDWFFNQFEKFKREEDEEELYVNMNYIEEIGLNKEFFEKIKFNYNLSKKLPEKKTKVKRGKI